MVFRLLRQSITHFSKILTLILVIPIFIPLKISSQESETIFMRPTENLSSAGETLYYLPIIMRRFNTDLSIQGYEVTQATQNPSNPVPLVAGRQSILRIYPRTNTLEPLSGISMAISAYRDDQLLPGSPITVGPGVVQVSPQREDIESSFNLHLPVEWLSDDITLTMEIDASHSIWEKDEANNELVTTLSFNVVPDLNVTIVPIDYIGANGDYPAPTTFSDVPNALMELYPVKAVNITLHESITAENLENIDGWNDLLDAILALKLSEGAPAPQVYYGYIPSQDSRGRTWLIYGQGIMGNGFVGLRAAIGLASSSLYGIDGGRIAAHEIGHNLSRLHAPCGVLQGVGPFPYPGAAIGQLGMNVMDFTQFSLIPADYKDLMSYCVPVWISDYTYRNLYEAQRQLGLLTAGQSAVQSLLIRAKIAEDSSITLEPIYALSGYPANTLVEGAYKLEFLDTTGRVISRQSLPLLAYADTPTSQTAIITLVKQPEEPYSSLRILHQNEIRLEKSLALQTDLGAPTAQILSVGHDGLLRWGYPDIPALIRYTNDHGSSWTTIQIDWLGGELFLDSKSLPAGRIDLEIILSDNIDTTIHAEWENNAS